MGVCSAKLGLSMHAHMVLLPLEITRMDDHSDIMYYLFRHTETNIAV